MFTRIKFFWSRRPAVSMPRRSKKYFRLHAAQARTLIEEKISYFNQFYQFEYKRIAIRNQKTRWGSCSSKKNINFNYKIIFLSDELQNYIVVHELCHLKELNHSKRFWALVEQSIPNHAVLRSQLKNTLL
jgi:predicted metal-dependent hydrolase